MSDDFGTDPKKMLDWNKKLGEQSEYVKKAIAPFLSGELTAKSEVFVLFNSLSVDGFFLGDELPVVEQLKSVGIEGTIHHDRVDIYDEKYLKELNIIHENFKLSYWRNTDELLGLEDFLGGYLVFDSGRENKNLDSYFVVGHPNEPDYGNGTRIMFFRNGEDIEDHKPKFSIDSKLDFHTSRKIVENTAKHFNVLVKNNIDYSFNEMRDKIIQQIPQEKRIDAFGTVSENFKEEGNSDHDRQLETAQKTGYVQGVCESVLAFNTDENKKIMSESTMTFLSKKLLSEMNVTKDMAQKFANPETYKALEQCVFTPKQEQQLEQTQSQGKSF